MTYYYYFKQFPNIDFIDKQNNNLDFRNYFGKFLNLSFENINHHDRTGCIFSKKVSKQS
jgi:hypothetical protein